VDPVAAAVRVTDSGDLERTGWLADDNPIHTGIWERASDGDRKETGPCEHRDYDAIADAWSCSCRSPPTPPAPSPCRVVTVFRPLPDYTQCFLLLSSHFESFLLRDSSR
jgi:hypothetical protein